MFITKHGYYPAMNTDDGNGAGSNGSASATATPPAPPKAVFDAAQQAKLDEIINGTVGRLKGEFEAKEATYLKQIKELESKAKEKPPIIDPKELTEKYVPKEDFMRLSDELKKTQDETNSIYTDIAKSKIKAAMEKTLQGKRPDVIEDYVDIVMKAVVVENRSFKIVDNGKMRVNVNGDPMSVEEYTEDFLAKRPSLLPPGAAGAGTGKNNGKGADSKELDKKEWDVLNPTEKMTYRWDAQRNAFVKKK